MHTFETVFAQWGDDVKDFLGRLLVNQGVQFEDMLTLQTFDRRERLSAVTGIQHKFLEEYVSSAHPI